jgi:integrase
MIIKKVYSKRLKRSLWSINGRIDGIQYRQARWDKKSDAEEFVENLRREARGGYPNLRAQAEVTTLGDLLEMRLRDPQCQSTRNRRRLVGFFEEFVNYTGPDLPLRNLSVTRLKQYRDSLLGFKPSTIEFKMAGVTGALNNARLYFPDFENFGAPRLPGLETIGREVIVSGSELHAVVDELRRVGRDKMADILELLILTGCRIGEILSLTQKQIDHERRVIVLLPEHTKTRRKREIPFSEASETIFRRWDDDCPSYRWFYLATVRAANSRGILVGYDNWRIHDIRHTAASILAEAGINTAIIARLLGHKIGGMTEKYIHATDPALRQAVNVLDGYWHGRKVAAFHLVD